MTVDNRVEESLSALVDGEATELEVRRLLKESSGESALRDKWHRYQLASAAMKRDLPPSFTDLSSKISEALEQEPVHNSRLSGVLQSLGKVAIAASVTVVAVFGVQQIQTTSAPGQPQAVVASEDASASGDAQFQLPAGFDLPPVSARTVSAGTQMPSQPRPTVLVSTRPVGELVDEEAIREYFNLQMERHIESSANASSGQGLLPLARLPQGETAP
jgi:sigma-E factor negative regulatory protein RseA